MLRVDNRQSSNAQPQAPARAVLMIEPAPAAARQNKLMKSKKARRTASRPHPQFEEMLSGGHPNSLGRTLEVVEIVFDEPSRLSDLYSCYFSEDEIVRLRVSNAMKRVCREHPEWLVPHVDGLLGEVAKIDQASTQWTLANLFQMLWDSMDRSQRSKAKALLKRNLERWDDWIVLNNSMEALAAWAGEDTRLKNWLLPRLAELRGDGRRSVAGRATKLHKKLSR